MKRHHVIRIAVCGFVAASSRPAAADSIAIGQITPAGLNYVSGITFDGGPNPLVTDGFGATMWRIDVSNAGVLATHALTGGLATTRSLEFDATTGNYYTNRRSGSNDQLTTVDPFTGAVTIVGTTGINFNFLSQAVEPGTGDLWLIADAGGADLYSVDKVTGAGTLVMTYAFAMGQVTAMAVDAGGRYFVASINGNIYEIFPGSATVVPITSTGLTGVDHFTDFEQDPTTGRWYGVEERRSATPRAWHLREITGLPSCNPCDANCDGSVDTGDIGPMVNALLGSGSGCSACQGDTNNDGSVNGLDLALFVDCLVGP